MWGNDIIPADDDLHIAVVPKENKLIQLYVMFLLLWQSLFRLSDTGMEILLVFFAKFSSAIATAFQINVLKEFLSKLPTTMYKAKMVIKVKGDSFSKYATCYKCSSIYPLEQCKVTLPDKSIVSCKCTHVEFPYHPQLHFRQPCNELLMKNVKSSSGTITLYPHGMFCYRSLIESLQFLLNRPNFVEKCQHWKSINHVDGVYKDVYDGAIWKEFLVYDHVPFLSLAYNFAFILNVDWFQPYHHTQYSLGVIYLAILNLPRKERYLQENIILVGIIPGPKEPKKHINSFLTPLVDELKQLWIGVMLKNAQGGTSVVRAALLCIACDIPAARKVAGFVGPTALHGCTKCFCSFPTIAFGEKPDYTNFDVQNWEPRKPETRQCVLQHYLACTTQNARADIERNYGIRYSVLDNLPYFDASRMTVIDPMHNLLLGTAKYILNVWKELNYLTNEHLIQIQSLINKFVCPGGIGRIPLKIASGFSDFTADQWKNWTLYFSLVALKSILPFRQYNHWHLFVKGCYLLCRRQITEDQLQEADCLLVEYCRQHVILYGRKYCTPNLHLHAHLASCVKDYGPVYAFWLFAFERLNGVLGSYHTNNHDVSLQVMRHFVNSQVVGPERWPDEYKDFHTLLSNASYSKGSLMPSTLESSLKSIDSCPIALPPTHEAIFPLHVKESLLNHLLPYYSGRNISVLAIHKKCKALKIGAFTIGSVKGKFTCSSRLLVKLPSTNSQQLVCIHYYAQCTIVSSETTSELLWTAAVSYYDDHQCRLWFGHPTEVWCTTTSSDIHFIPISMIKSQVAFVESTFNFGRLIGEQLVQVIVPVESS